MKIMFTGDVVISGEKSEDDLLTEDLKKMLRGIDILCCNFEAPVPGNAKKKKKVGPNNTNGLATISKLSKAGFKLATLANNHIFDYGYEGMCNTIQQLNNHGIKTIGAGIENKILEPFITNDGSIGILNVAENGFGCSVDESDKYGYAYIFRKDLKKNIFELKEKCQFVIIVVHAGAEQWDYPLPEWREVYYGLIEAGADAVIAHHPHVPQGWEIYKNKPIFYSLGNFAFDKGDGAIFPESYCVLLDFNVPENEVTYEIIPTIFRNGKIDYNDDINFFQHLQYCCDLLKDNSKYIDTVNRKCLEDYELYKKYYAKVTCHYIGGLKEHLKGFIKRWFLNISFQNIWLYHNISIETHLYICKRALRIKLKQEHILD